MHHWRPSFFARVTSYAMVMRCKKINIVTFSLKYDYFIRMRHAESKTHEDICVYRRPNDTVVFSTTLFKENHLNRYEEL